MSANSLSQPTTYFAFLVLLLLGLFLYIGQALQSAPDAQAPADPASSAQPSDEDETPSLQSATAVDRTPAQRDTDARERTGLDPLPAGEPLAPLEPQEPLASTAGAEPAEIAPPPVRQTPQVSVERASAPSTEAHLYVVRPGDTLTGIAHRQCGSSRHWRTIARLNKDVLPDPDRLTVGMRLRLPGRGERAPRPERPHRWSGRTYTVQEGDGTLLNLAVRLYGTRDAEPLLRRANRQALEESGGALRAGMVLRVPPAPRDLVPTAPRTYTVREGDTLTGIAQRFYNDPTKWRLIQRANPDEIPDEHQLRVGAELTIPQL